jgi:hypothetical protein
MTKERENKVGRKNGIEKKEVRKNGWTKGGAEGREEKEERNRERRKKGRKEGLKLGQGEEGRKEERK